MDFKGAAKRLDDLDLPRIGATIGIGEDELHAVLDVETRGGGFDKFGRPKMLFEPHVFFRELSGAEREEAVAAGLAYRRWGERRYPTDSYPRLHQAMLIDADAALRSCSWGLGQIMGFNCALAGYRNARDMVQAFLRDEETHLEAMVSFIVSAGLDDELRRHDWRGFARGYNGPGYAAHGYHTKLERAFRKWQAIPNTPFKIDRAPVAVNPPTEYDETLMPKTLRNGSKGPFVRDLQEALQRLGHFSTRIDGDFGRRTRAAVVAFQADQGLIADGVVGPATWAALDAAKPAPLRDVTESDLRKDGSATVMGADTAQAGAVLGLGGLSVAEVLDKAEAASGALTRSEGLMAKAQALVMTYWPVILAGVALFVVWRGASLVKDARLRDALTGRNPTR